MKNKKGVSLVLLVVTVIVMSILTGAVILTIGDEDVINNSKTAVTAYTISEVKEQLKSVNSMRESGLEGNYLQPVVNGTLEEIGIDDVELNKKLLIQNGNVVYRPEYLDHKEIEQCKESGIVAGDYIAIVSSMSSKTNYADITNVYTIDEFKAKPISDVNKAMICLLEDVSGWQTIDTFNGVILGGGNTITSVTAPIVKTNNGEIKGLTLEGEITSTETYIAALTMDNNGLVYDCHSKVNITTEGIAASIAIHNKDSGIIVNCSNKGNIESNITATAGLVLVNDGKLYTSYNSGNINNGREGYGGADAGGIVCEQRGEMYNCYNTGNVNVENEFAGRIAGVATLVPNNRKTLTKNSYNLGTITGINPGAISNEYSDYIVNCYSTSAACSKPFYKGEINEDIKYWIEDLGTSAAEQKQQLLINLNNGNSSKVWVEDTKNINNGYPILYWQAE